MTAGQVAPSLVFVLAGSVAVTEHDHLDSHQPIVTYGEGDSKGELAQLAGRPRGARRRDCRDCRLSDFSQHRHVDGHAM
jgi:hypothetical protein